jgi:hypothetical protein
MVSDEWGAEWTLAVSDLGAGKLQASLSANTAAYSGTRTHLVAGAFKVSTQIENLSLVHTTAGDAWLDWNTRGGPLANGCKGNNGSFGCSFADWSDGSDSFFGSALADRDVHEWVWTFEDNGTLFDGWLGDGPIEEGHVGGQYWHITFNSPATLVRTKGAIVSLETGGTPPIPEPSSAILFGFGALLVTAALRRESPSRAPASSSCSQ